MDVVRAEAAARRHSAAWSCAGGKTASGNGAARWRCPTPSSASANRRIWRASPPRSGSPRRADDRQDGVGEAVAERLPRPPDHRLGVRLVADVEDHPAAVDPADIGAIRPVRRDHQRVHPHPVVEPVHARRRLGRVALARAGQPPAADLAARADRRVDDHQELVVQRVARDEIARAGREIGVPPVGEPDEMDAARVRTRGVEMRQLPWLRRIGDVVDVEPGVVLARLWRSGARPPSSCRRGPANCSARTAPRPGSA